MLKPEQVPHAAMNALLLALRQRRSGKEAITAAINAWPGMGPIRTDQPIGDWCDKLPAIILPLLQEKQND